MKKKILSNSMDLFVAYIVGTAADDADNNEISISERKLQIEMNYELLQKKDSQFKEYIFTKKKN